MAYEVAELVVGVLLELRNDLQEVAWMAIEQMGYDMILRTIIVELEHLNSLGRNYGRYRSVVRLVGSLLPLKKVQRPVLCLGPYERFEPDLNSTTCWSEREDDLESFTQSPCDLELKDIDSLSGVSLGSVSTTKMASLEEEMAQLKVQIAMLVAASQPNNKPDNTVPTAPPAPPPLPTSFTNQSISESKANWPISQTTVQIPSHNNYNNNARSMLDVLRGLSHVKLKPIARSPGGTPLRLHNPADYQGNDAGTIIANALKRRFERMNCLDEENSESEDADAEEGKENDPFTTSQSPPIPMLNKRQTEHLCQHQYLRT